MKRSNEPLFWALFGAGGMLSALIGPILIFVTGIAVPLGLLLGPHTMSYAHMLAFTRNPVGKLFVFVVISLFLFHGCHRMLHSLHDLGHHPGSFGKWIFYGIATFFTVYAAFLLMAIGS